MGLRVEGSTVISRPAEEIWTYLSDLDNLKSWDPGTSEVIWQSPIGLGTRFQIAVGTKVRIRGDAVISEFEPGRLIGIESRPRAPGWVTGGGRSWVRATYSVDPTEPGATRLTRVFEAEVHGVLRLLGPFIGPMAKRERYAEIENVKRILEE
jgi:carbon monoxide dehydrogenase subunit G